MVCFLPKNDKLLHMAYMMQIEPKYDITYSRFMHNFKSAYSIAEKSNFINSWIKKIQVVKNWENLQWFNDYVNQMAFFLSQIEECQLGYLIVWLVNSSRPQLVIDLIELVYSQHLIDLPCSEEFNTQIYYPRERMSDFINKPVTNLLRKHPPIIRRILLLRLQLESRMMEHLYELQQQIRLEIDLELERLLNL